MKQYLIPFLTSIVVFGIVILIPFKFASRESNVVVEFSSQVLEDDNFQLFYKDEDMLSFANEFSIHKSIVGKLEIQNIKFEIPAGKPLVQIRLDIGQNTQQKPIKIESVNIRFLSMSSTLDIMKLFTPNEYIKFEDGQFITHEVNELKYSYDPYLVTNASFREIVTRLMKKQHLIEFSIRLLIALLLALISFIFVNKCQSYKSLLTTIYIVLFIGIITSPTVVKLFNIDIKTGIVEKRDLADKPILQLTKEYPANFENYYNDNFSLRELLINFSGKLKTQLFNVSAKPELVQIGKDNFLFYNIVDYYSNSYKYSKSEVDNVFEFQSDQMKKLSEHGIKYILGFWPNKHSIYEEKYPFAMQMQVINDTTFSDRILKRFKSEGMKLFDVRKELRNSKAGNQIYYKIDTHWNEHGAYLAYKSFCNQTFSELGLTAFNEETFTITYREINTGDLTNMLGISKSSLFKDKAPVYTLKNKDIGYRTILANGFPDQTEITINENCTNHQTVLVFHDSYANSLKQFLSLHYNKVVYVWSYPIESHPMDKASIVKQVSPDIIINCCVERYLPNLLLKTDANILYK